MAFLYIILLLEIIIAADSSNSGKIVDKLLTNPNPTTPPESGDTYVGPEGAPE